MSNPRRPFTKYSVIASHTAPRVSYGVAQVDVGGRAVHQDGEGGKVALGRARLRQVGYVAQINGGRDRI